METFDTKDAEITVDRWPKGVPLPSSSPKPGLFLLPSGEPLIAYNPISKKMEKVTPPYTYIDENGSTWHVTDKPITGITIGTF